MMNVICLSTERKGLFKHIYIYILKEGIYGGTWRSFVELITVDTTKPYTRVSYFFEFFFFPTEKWNMFWEKLFRNALKRTLAN